MSQPKQGSVISTSVLLSIYNGLSDHRAEFRRGLVANGIRIEELQDHRKFVDLHRFVRLFEWLASELDEPALGLKLSQRAGADALGAVGYLFLSSGNLETALQSLQRYLAAVQSSSMTEIRYVDDYVQVRYRIIDETISPRVQDSEYSLGLIWRYMRLLSKSQCQLAQVAFEHEKPGDGDNIYKRVFNAPVLFGQSDNALTFHVDEARRWYEGSDQHLIPILEEHISSTMKQAYMPRSFRDVVSQALTDSVLQQGARARLLSGMLRISTATLHRRLRNENCTFKALVESQSRALAERLLRDSNLSIASISSRVGFSDPAAFCRAFRRWFGTSAGDYRQKLR